MTKTWIKSLFTFALALCAGLAYADVTSSFGVNFTTGDSGQVIMTTEDQGAGFSTENYSAPTNWLSVAGGADDAYNITFDNVTYRILWTSRGTWNSSVSTDTNDGKLLYGYLDDVASAGARTKATVTVTGLPTDKKYTVALILSGDGDGATDYNNVYSPVYINGEVYSYNGTELVTGDSAREVTQWGNRSKTASASMEIGTNVMLVEGLSGSVLSITSAMDDSLVSRLTIAGVQVWITDDAPEAVTPPEDKEVFSINFDSEEGAVASDSSAGLVDVKGWNNLSGASGSAELLDMWDGAAMVSEAVDLTYSSKNVWAWSSATDSFLKGYLDDGSTVQISLSGIPFTEYSVIIYAATDTANGAFMPVSVNGAWYIGSSVVTPRGYNEIVLEQEKSSVFWGQSQTFTAQYGINALRVDGLSGVLSISGGAKNGNNRGCIAAIQIVNTGTYGDVRTEWTNKSGDGMWETDANWSNGLPDENSVAIVNCEQESVTLSVPDDGVAVGAVSFDGDGTITLSGGKITSSKITVNTDVVASDTTLSMAPMMIAESATIQYTAASGITLPVFTGTGTFSKFGAGKITLDYSKDCTPNIVMNEGTLSFNQDIIFPNTYNITLKNGSVLLVENAFARITSANNVFRMEGGSKIKLQNGNSYVADRPVTASIIVSNATEENPALIEGSIYGNVSKVAGSITGNGVLSFVQSGNTYIVASTIKDSGIEGESLKVKMSAGAVTFSGESTFTSGFEVASGATANMSNSKALGSGVATINGTLALQGVALASKITGSGELSDSSGIITFADGGAIVPSYDNCLTATCAIEAKFDVSSLVGSSDKRFDLLKASSLDYLPAKFTNDNFVGGLPKGWQVVPTEDGLGWALIRKKFHIIVR